MKIKAYKETASKETLPVLLKVKDTSDGGVTLMVVGEDGERRSGGDLIRFDRFGAVTLASSINEEFGFKLDTWRKLKVT